jgi:hypothetical protein
MFDKNFEEILMALTNHHVDFMLVGGYAVNFHGYNRSTSDMDIWVKPADANKKKLIAALSSLHFRNTELIEGLDFTQPFCFRLGEEPYPVDIFTFLSGVNYEDAEKIMIPFETTESVKVNFIHYTHLILNKMLTGRNKDKIDVEELQKVLQFKKKSPSG